MASMVSTEVVAFAPGERFEFQDNESDDEQLLPPPLAWFEDSGTTPFPQSSFHDDTSPAKRSVSRSMPPLHLAASKAAAVGAPRPSPSWNEISSQVLPSAARELLSSSLRRIYHTARWTYSQSRWYRKYSDLGNNSGGYFRSPEMNHLDLPPFSSLPWVDRQLVQEWRTYVPDDETGNEEVDFDRARALVPAPITRPLWQKAEVCHSCHKTFGPTRLRHHCRLCAKSFCQAHSSYTHQLPHLGYDPDVPERVCDSCKQALLEQNLAERVAWRLARCRDFSEGSLTPYFETGVDTLELAALRITQAALSMAKSIPLGAQATVAVETVDVLRKYGLNGIYTIMLRQEFLAAADLLRKALGINRTSWPLSVHELSAAIFYALAQHRAMRGLSPDREHQIHSFRDKIGGLEDKPLPEEEEAPYDPMAASMSESSETLPFAPVCDPVPDTVLASLTFYAPLALKFIYAPKEVDMQLLAAQQGWRLLYAYLEQDAGPKATERPASALFVHEEKKIACIAVRGTATIHDVVTDIRQIPVPFPESDPDTSSQHGQQDEGWTTVSRGQGVAVCGMSSAAMNLYREHIDSLLVLAKKGYRIRMTGHSLGGAVATLLGVLVERDLQRESLSPGRGGSEGTAPLKVYNYGTPSCVDLSLSEYVESFVTTAVLHDDVVPRLTPTSCRGLLKHLLHIRETWVKAHLTDDLMAITERAKTAWAPRWRGSFTLAPSSSSIKRYCRKQYQYGKRQLLSVKGKLVGDEMPRDESAPMGKITEESGSESVFSLDESQLDEENGEENIVASDDEQEEPRLLLDYMGGIDAKFPGVLIDGDEFFDADKDSLLDSGEEASVYGDAMNQSSLIESCLDKERALVETSGGDAISKVESTVALDSDEGLDDSSPETVVLEETPLPQMFIPGKIVHMYSHRGVYKTAYVPRTFRELRRISLAGNMLADHKCQDYYEALLEVRSVRRAVEAPPRWTAFDEDDTCSCCASRFTWASTSDSAAQEARDKHNCRSCGTLVCAPCSENRIPIPTIGLTTSARVCDRCYNDMDGVLTSPSLEEGDETSEVDLRGLDLDDRPERSRERRSAIVDELASRVKASPLTCS